MNHIFKKARLMKVILILGTLMLIGGMLVPEAAVVASPINVPVGSGEESVLSLNVLESDFRMLKTMHNRNQQKVKPLEKGLNRLLTDYRRLQEKGIKSWVDMRVLYYDYNSAYQAAISHRYESGALIATHSGFSASGKVINADQARYTVQALRGSVTGMISRINDCNWIMRKAKILMKAVVKKYDKKK